MGLEDRQYYRQDEYSSYSKFSLGGRSIITSIIIINIAIFLVDAFTPKFVGLGVGTHWLSYLLGVKFDQPWFIWTYLTYGFAHSSYDSSAGLMHIGGNMLGLWMLGRSVEDRLGKREFLRFYLISIVVAGVGFTLIRHLLQHKFFIIGASGGVTAVIMLFVFMFPRDQIRLFGVIPMPAWLLGVMLVTSDFFQAFKPDSHIAWEAHLLGAAFGAVYFLQRWEFSRFQFANAGRLFKPRPKLRVHHPGAIDDSLQAQADLILQKISEQGEDSLTSRERKTLNKYSQQLRKNRS